MKSETPQPAAAQSLKEELKRVLPLQKQMAEHVIGLAGGKPTDDAYYRGKADGIQQVMDSIAFVEERSEVQPPAAATQEPVKLLEVDDVRAWLKVSEQRVHIGVLSFDFNHARRLAHDILELIEPEPVRMGGHQPECRWDTATKRNACIEGCEIKRINDSVQPAAAPPATDLKCSGQMHIYQNADVYCQCRACSRTVIGPLCNIDATNPNAHTLFTVESQVTDAQRGLDTIPCECCQWPMPFQVLNRNLICPCCGYEPEYDSKMVPGIVGYREAWVTRGMPWFDEEEPKPLILQPAAATQETTKPMIDNPLGWKLGQCQECGCTTGGGGFCYEHKPYTVYPKADGSFITARYGRKHISFDEPPLQPAAAAQQEPE